MTSILRRMGLYRALNASAVQFNSIVFRVVVGFLAGVPGEIVALIPAIEFFLNFLLEIPTGYLADRYGRIPFAIAGHVTVILGLTCGYLALTEILGPSNTTLLFILHGVFIGFTRPLTSGSVEAFYQDALQGASTSPATDSVVSKSFTLSKVYGRHLTTISVVLAFSVIYVFHQTIGAQHAFVVGIALWLAALIKLMTDFRILGDSAHKASHVVDIFRAFSRSRVALISLMHALASFMLLGIVMGYFIVSLGREVTFSDPSLKWACIVAFMMGSQGLGWIAKSYILPSMIQKVSERRYLSIFYSALFLSGSTLFWSFNYLPQWSLPVVTGIFGIIFFTSFSAIQGVAHNMVLGQVENSDYATALSIQNMPGLLFVGFYSLYLTLFSGGSPTIHELFASVAIISFSFLFLHMITSVNKDKESEQI